MFRKNPRKRQNAFLDATMRMDERTNDKLMKTWAPIFYNEVFLRIDESHFECLYSNTGAPNYPVNILLSLEYIKHMKDCSDQELLDSYSLMV